MCCVLLRCVALVCCVMSFGVVRCSVCAEGVCVVCVSVCLYYALLRCIAFVMCVVFVLCYVLFCFVLRCVLRSVLPAR